MLPVVSPMFDLLTCDVKLVSAVVILFAFKRCKRDELEIAVSSIAEVCVTAFSVLETGKSNIGSRDQLVTVCSRSVAMA